MLIAATACLAARLPDVGGALCTHRDGLCACRPDSWGSEWGTNDLDEVSVNEGKIVLGENETDELWLEIQVLSVVF